MSGDQALPPTMHSAPINLPDATLSKASLVTAKTSLGGESKLDLDEEKKIASPDIALSTGTSIAFVEFPHENFHAGIHTSKSLSHTALLRPNAARSKSSLHAVPLNRADGSRRSNINSEPNVETCQPVFWKYERFFPGTNRWQIPLKGRKLMIAINAVGGLAILYYGYDQGVMAGVNGTENYKKVMGVNSYPQTSRDSAAIGGIVAIYYLGTLVGGLIGGSLADRLGRVKSE